MADAQATVQAWRVDYNTRRPHSSLGHLPPTEFGRQRQVELTAQKSSALVKSCLRREPTSSVTLAVLYSLYPLCFGQTMADRRN
ncbi:MAG: integrase core domain-containing protein [Nitrospiraceae bacterium]